MNLLEQIAPAARFRKIGRASGRDKALVHGNIGAADEIEHAPGYCQCTYSTLDIAVDCRAGDELQRRMQRRQHDRHRIVGAGVDVEDEFAGTARSR